MTSVDADAHVEESPSTFRFLEKEHYPRRPLALGFDRDTVYGTRNALWLVDGQTYPKPVGRAAMPFLTPTLMDAARQKPVSIPAQEMTDVEARLKDLDRMGIDVQVVYPTLFLTTTTHDVRFEAALFRSYNSFVADACTKSVGRIRFAALVPIRDVEESVRELSRAKSLGAVSIMLHGVAWDRNLGHRDLWPFYEAAAGLDLPVCVHHSWGSPAMTEAFDHPASFTSATLPVLMGFYSILVSGVLDAVPKLRLAFLETGSMWIPYLIQQLRRRRGSGAKRKDPADYFHGGRIFIGCEADEDIGYLTQWVGEDALVIGSDYPHVDVSHEGLVTEALMKREDVPSRVKEKILSANPRRLYGL